MYQREEKKHLCGKSKRLLWQQIAHRVNPPVESRLEEVYEPLKHLVDLCSSHYSIPGTLNLDKAITFLDIVRGRNHAMFEYFRRIQI